MLKRDFSIVCIRLYIFFFFFQAEDGIRDLTVTGVQTCALPILIFHGLGSTAISGIVYYEDDLWPEEYRNNIFTGNVMTSRVNRDAVTFTGSTPQANERPDFVVTDDPWFRPVNLQLGPDGALYIADFYNRIIGHYEVPLTHPAPDRTSGRIWA